MTHMLYDPKCLAADDASILAQIPKKLDRKLDEGTGAPPDGWGLYLEEDIDVSAITGVVFMVFFLASLLLFIVWVAHKHNIQIAPIAAYLIATAGMFGAWMAMRNKSAT